MTSDDLRATIAEALMNAQRDNHNKGGAHLLTWQVEADVVMREVAGAVTSISNPWVEGGTYHSDWHDGFEEARDIILALLGEVQPCPG